MDAEEERVKEFYGNLPVHKLIKNTPKKDIKIIMGYFKACGPFKGISVGDGLGTKNEAGQRLMKFCIVNEPDLIQDLHNMEDDGILG